MKFLLEDCHTGRLWLGYLLKMHGGIQIFTRLCGSMNHDFERYKMPKLTFEEIKKLLLLSINEFRCEAELSLTFTDRPNDYMIIIYEDHCSFQRCGRAEERSGEYNYATLDELYKAQLIDNIILERDWNKIKDIDCMDFDMLGLWEQGNGVKP